MLKHLTALATALIILASFSPAAFAEQEEAAQEALRVLNLLAGAKDHAAPADLSLAMKTNGFVYFPPQGEAAATPPSRSVRHAGSMATDGWTIAVGFLEGGSVATTRDSGFYESFLVCGPTYKTVFVVDGNAIACSIPAGWW